MVRRAQKISDLVIDEISLVDKGANQHAVVTIAKNADGETKESEMEFDIFDEQGNPLDVASLSEGDEVYDDEGNAYVMELDGGDDDGIDDEAYQMYEDEHDPVEVGKKYVGYRTVDAPSFASRLTRAGMKTRDTASTLRRGAAGSRKRGPLTERENYARGVRRRVGGAAAAGGAAAGGGGAYAYDRKVRKSYANEIREELSKALTDKDREEVISKALGHVGELAYEVEIAKAAAAQERELRMEREYTEIAKSYNLPIEDEELGGVLMRCAENLSVEDCEVISKCMEAAGAAVFQEYGFIGGGDNADVYEQVQAELVSKSGDVSEADMAAFFEQHPEAYDDYLSERN
jgi:hypothetical protein